MLHAEHATSQAPLLLGPDLTRVYEAIARGEIAVAKNCFSIAAIARATDRDPSHLAAELMTESGIRANQQNRVLAAVRRWPGYTARELARAMELPTRDMPARRMADLVPLYVEAGPDRECLVSGETATTWYPTNSRIWFSKGDAMLTGPQPTELEEALAKTFGTDLERILRAAMQPFSNPTEAMRLLLARELRAGLKRAGKR